MMILKNMKNMYLMFNSQNHKNYKHKYNIKKNKPRHNCLLKLFHRFCTLLRLCDIKILKAVHEAPVCVWAHVHFITCQNFGVPVPLPVNMH